MYKAIAPCKTLPNTCNAKLDEILFTSNKPDTCHAKKGYIPVMLKEARHLSC